MKNIIHLAALAGLLVLCADTSAGTPTPENDAFGRLSAWETDTNKRVTASTEPTDKRPKAVLPSGLPSVSRDSVQFVRPLAQAGDVHLLVAPPLLQSKSYYKVVSGAALTKGVALPVDAPGAIVRVTTAPTPSGVLQQKSSPVLEPDDLILENPSGARLNLDKRTALSAKTKELAQLHPDLFSKTSAFRVPEVLGAGVLTLRAAKAIPEAAIYTIHVFDKQSHRVMRAKPDKINVTPGQPVRVTTSVDGSRLDHLQAVWKTPDGRQFPARTKITRGNVWTISASAPAVDLRAGELVSLAIQAMADGPHGAVLRYQEVPVRVFDKTASLTGEVHQRPMPRATVLEYGIRVNKEGRYEIRALVFGKDSSGSWKPAAMLFSADYLQPGTSRLSVRLGADELAKSGLSAPFAVREVQLMDQGQIAVLESGQRYSEIRFQKLVPRDGRLR